MAYFFEVLERGLTDDDGRGNRALAGGLVRTAGAATAPRSVLAISTTKWTWFGISTNASPMAVGKR